MSSWRKAADGVHARHQAERDRIAFEDLVEDRVQDLNEVMHKVLKAFESAGYISRSVDGACVLHMPDSPWLGVDDYNINVTVLYGSVHWRLQKGMDDNSIDGVSADKIAEGFALGMTSEAEFARWRVTRGIHSHEELEWHFDEAKRYMLTACLSQLQLMDVPPPPL